MTDESTIGKNERDYLTTLESSLIAPRKEYLESFFRKNSQSSINLLYHKGEDHFGIPSSYEGLSQLYHSVRAKQHKVPSLTFFKPELTGSRDIHKRNLQAINSKYMLSDMVRIKSEGEGRTLYIGGIAVVGFSPVMDARTDAYILENDLDGAFRFNTDFLQCLDPGKKFGTSSEARNIAKGFFKVEDKKHVIMVQYLHESGKTSEHYHTLPEIIAQLAGCSIIEMRHIENDVDVQKESLYPGQKVLIPPMHSHILYSDGGASITVPVKKTISKRLDHFYQQKSAARMNGELRQIMDIPHYESGTAMLVTIEQYRAELTPEESQAFNKLVAEISSSEKNPNLARVLQELKGLTF